MCFFHRWGTERQVNIIPASWVYNNGRCPEGRDETASRGVHAFLVLFIARTPSRALHHATMTPWLQLSIRLSSLECLSLFHLHLWLLSLSLSLQAVKSSTDSFTNSLLSLVFVHFFSVGVPQTRPSGISHPIPCGFSLERRREWGKQRLRKLGRRTSNGWQRRVHKLGSFVGERGRLDVYGTIACCSFVVVNENETRQGNNGGSKREFVYIACNLTPCATFVDSLYVVNLVNFCASVSKDLDEGLGASRVKYHDSFVPLESLTLHILIVRLIIP